MPLVKGARSKLYTSSSNPRPPYITDVEKLQDSLVRSQHEVLRMREQMEFLAFLVRRAWQGDKSAITDVANIVGCENRTTNETLLQFSGSYDKSDGDKWASLVERMLLDERSKDKQQRSTVKLTAREVMLEDEILNHKPVFSSFLNKPRGNFNQELRPKTSAIPTRRSNSPTAMRSSSPQPNKSSTNLMNKPPTAPSSSPRNTPNLRPNSAPQNHNVSVGVHGSEVMIAHKSKLGRCLLHSEVCVCPVIRFNKEEVWRTSSRYGVPTSAKAWDDQGNLKFGMDVLKEKDQLMVAILCSSGK